MPRGTDTDSCRPSTCCCRLYEFIWAFWFRGPCSPGITPSGSHSLSTCSSAEFPEPWRKGFDGDNPFRPYFSKVLHFEWFPAVGLFTCSHLLQEKASLMMVDQSTDPWVQHDIIRSPVITVGLLLSFVLFVCSLQKSYLCYHRFLSNLVSCSWSPKYCLWVLSCGVDLSQISIGWLLPQALCHKNGELVNWKMNMIILFRLTDA